MYRWTCDVRGVMIPRAPWVWCTASRIGMPNGKRPSVSPVTDAFPCRAFLDDRTASGLDQIPQF
jgi:hypothetical protein